MQLRPFAGALSVIVTSKRLLWKRPGNVDFHVFDWQAWAVASGKINDFPNDKARWKTNFRSALNNLSERFKMVQDNSKNSDDPHKIYQIINTGCKSILICTLPVQQRGLTANLSSHWQASMKTCQHSPPRKIPTWISTALLCSSSRFSLRCRITRSLFPFAINLW